MSKLQNLKTSIAQGELEHVFRELPSLLPPDAPQVSELIILEGQYLHNKRDERSGTASREEIAQERNRIGQALLEVIRILEETPEQPGANQSTFGQQLRSIRALFNNPEQLSHAFSRLERIIEAQHPSQMKLLSPLRADYQAHRTDFIITQTIRREEYMRAFRRCVKGLEELLQVLAAEEERLKGKGVQLSGELARVNCDRKKIIRRFLQRFEQKEEQRAAAHFYLLHDQKYGQSESLVRRLITQLRQDYSGKVKYSGFRQIDIKRVELHAEDKLPDSQFSLRKGFNRGLRPEPKSLAELLKKAPAHYPKLHGFTYLPFVLRLQLPEACWKNCGQDALKWWLTEFCQIPERQSQVPVVFLIIDLQADKTAAATPGGWRSLFSSKKEVKPDFDPARAIQDFQKKLSSDYTLLPPLMRVKRADLYDWYTAFEDNERRREEKVSEIIQRLGADQESWHMADVEKELERIIAEQQNAAYNL